MTVALVTGGSSGIGRAAALRLAERGTGIVLTYRTHPEGAQEAVEEIEKAGGTAVALPLDLGRSETFPEFARTVRRTLAGTWQADSFEYLLNNAGLSGAAPFAETTEELFDRLHRVLLKGPFFLTQALLPLLADGGAIVNVTSNSAMRSGMTAGYSVYGSLKGALGVLTAYQAKELGAARRIRVNAIAPGPTRTRLGDDGFERFPELIAPIVEQTVLGRLGEPADVGKVIAFLLSDEGAWVTGQEFEAAGGYQL